MRKLIVILALAAIVTTCGSCAKKSGDMKDGYYTAECAEFSEYGWKEYVTIYVSNNKILTVEYDAYNASGFVRSWDLNYMRVMNRVAGTYPNKFTREYSVELLNKQNSTAVDAISGATDAHSFFIMLAEAAIEQARLGIDDVVLVDIGESKTAAEG